jgi:hypothetical protein
MWLIQFSVAAKRGTPANSGGCVRNPLENVEMPNPPKGPKEQGTGESQGGAYPNPHSGKRPKGAADTFLGHGGQTEIAYQGPDNPNATTEDEGASDDQ